MLWPKKRLEITFFTQKSPKKTVFNLKYDILKKPPCTLQKLSLKRRIQSSLISGGVVEYLLDTLGADVVVDEKSNSTKKQLFVLTDYALEYCTALLMNLCLRSFGRMKAADHGAGKLLGIMTELLRHDDIEVRPYTNGILYTMLQDKRVWDEAQKINLKDMINDFSDNIQKI